MRTLLLVRHATAASGSPDMARILTAQGRAEAADIARCLAPLLSRPTIILSSPAARTLETAQAVRGLAPPAAELRVVSNLYLAAPDILLDTVMAEGGDAENIVLVAHNPGIGQLAFDLGGGHHPHIARGFTPATVALFDCTIDNWMDIAPARTALRHALAPFEQP